MDRVKIDFPDIVQHTCTLPILIQHINYGNHVGNDSIVSLLHHARLELLQHFGYSELQIEEVGLIMADLQVQYKAQLYINNTIQISTCIKDFSKIGFSIYYKIEKLGADNNQLAVLAKTNMLCFDYSKQAIAAVPVPFINKISSTTN